MTITLGMILEAMAEALLAMVVAGVVYIIATKFYNAVASASRAKREKAKKMYYPAYIWGNRVVIKPRAISRSAAIKK